MKAKDAWNQFCSVWVPGFPSIVVRCGFVLGWEGCGGRVFCPGPSSSSVSVSSPGPISSVVSGVAACQPMTLCHHDIMSSSTPAWHLSAITRKTRGNNYTFAHKVWWSDKLPHGSQPSSECLLQMLSGQWRFEFFTLNHVLIDVKLCLFVFVECVTF